jgi:hypothetical protein
VKIKVASLEPGQEVAIANCVETGRIVSRSEKNLYIVNWRGRNITMRRSELGVKRDGRWHFGPWIRRAPLASPDSIYILILSIHSPATNGEGFMFTTLQVDRAKSIIREAQADLGSDLGGFSPVDLLLDNMPELNGSEQARDLLRMIDDSTFFRSWPLFNHSPATKARVIQMRLIFRLFAVAGLSVLLTVYVVSYVVELARDKAAIARSI